VISYYSLFFAPDSCGKENLQPAGSKKKKLCWMMDEDEDVGRGISKGMMCDAAMQVG
jgi:hypothetical protein